MKLKQSFWFHLLIAVVVSFLIFIIFFSSLGWLTNHGDSKKVPVVVGQQIEGATKMLEAAGFKVEIQDSVYLDSLPKLSIIKQSPEGDAIVKSNRTIFLTINRAVPPQVEMPDLKGFSFRSAEMMLATLNLKLGDTSYQPYVARNAVLQQTFNGKDIAKGTKLDQGSVISLVLGSGVGKEEFDVPNLIGMTLAEAQQVLTSKTITRGSIINAPGCNVGDRESAFIVKQTPMPFELNVDGTRKATNRMRSGQVMDLYICDTKPVNDTAAAATPAQD